MAGSSESSNGTPVYITFQELIGEDLLASDE